MAIGDVDVGQELLNVPMGKMIKEMATAIADAQWQLDKASMTVAELMSGQRLLRDLDSGKLIGGNGQEIKPDANGRVVPQTVDSRVYFGYTISSNEKGEVVREPLKVSMMELGFTPTFYQFVDTIIEVKISISITGTTEKVDTSSSESASASRSTDSNVYYRQSGWWWASQQAAAGYSSSSRTSVSTSQVNAAYSSKFSYSVEGASLLRTKLVPVPPPAILEDRIREVMLLERAYIQYKTRIDLLTAEESRTDTTAERRRAIADEKTDAQKRLMDSMG